MTRPSDPARPSGVKSLKPQKRYLREFIPDMLGYLVASESGVSSQANHLQKTR